MVAIISITFIILSTVVLTLNTLPYFMQKADSAGAEKDYPPFALLEAIYMSWFTFEFLVRQSLEADSLKYLKFDRSRSSGSCLRKVTTEHFNIYRDLQIYL